ncbi:MAG: nucleotide 5'-monophosphate nucleosidase PpnN [Pseudomonadota bacterium]
MSQRFVDASVAPEGILEILSKQEVQKLLDVSNEGLYGLFRRCCLAVLNCGAETDNAKEIFQTYRNFDVDLVHRDRGIKLVLRNAPEIAFVDGVMIQGIREHLFAVLRDVIYTSNEIIENDQFDLAEPTSITDAVFHILRNGEVLTPQADPNLVVCWGGHSIGRVEYDYTKKVGYELGLRGLNVCTGCGPGAMKGPMKGANIGHAKQRKRNGRYIGITEPGIIAAESPNPIVNSLVIMPDIEKRLEAFVRTGHGIIVFPGGVGTAEEILYLLGILLNPENSEIPFPLVFTGPASAKDYFQQIDDFIASTLGPQAQELYKIIVDDPAAVAREMYSGLKNVRDHRVDTKDAFYFNWMLRIEPDFQQPFVPTHDNMGTLEISKDLPSHLLAANLRRAFSGIVAGNVKEDGIAAIEANGPFEIRGDKVMMKKLDALLAAFVKDQRMKLDGKTYEPVYRVIT